MVPMSGYVMILYLSFKTIEGMKLVQMILKHISKMASC